MKKIYVKWASSESVNSYNFGDDLAPYLIEKLSGQKIRYVRFANTRINVFKEFLTLIFKGNLNMKLFKDFITSFFIKNYIISIGSILQWYSSRRCIVWGSGIIKNNDSIRNSNFLAVRGIYTQKRIRELGYIAPDVLGDPALLLPLVYYPKSKKIYKLGIIPHISHFELMKKMSISEDILLIDLNTNRIEDVVNHILSCEKIISTSLHGLIVSHAYKIDAIWFELINQPLHGDKIKFYDYFSSIGIPNYKPYDIGFDDTIDIHKILYLFENRKEINCINTDLEKIQYDLLGIAPFSLKNKFKYIHK